VTRPRTHDWDIRISVRESPIILFIDLACFRNGTAVRTICCLQAMRRRYPQPEENGLTIALYCAGCMCVCGLFVFGFCKMFEPRHIENVGLAAYEPFPATVVNYQPTYNVSHAAPAEPDIPESSGKATEVVSTQPLATPADHPVRPEHAKHTLGVEPKARTAKIRETSSQRAERSVSSRSHAESDRFAASLAAAYPGYAMLH
jgi:hypothetical protein